MKTKSFFFRIFISKDEQNNLNLSEKTSFIKKKLIQREESLEKYQKQMNYVNQQLLLYKKSLENDPKYTLELL